MDKFRKSAAALTTPGKPDHMDLSPQKSAAKQKKSVRYTRLAEEEQEENKDEQNNAYMYKPVQI